MFGKLNNFLSVHCIDLNISHFSTHDTVLYVAKQVKIENIITMVVG